MSVNHSAMKLGRKPTRFDSRIPRFSRYLTTELPFTPPVADWSQKVSHWGMLKNDTVGDCTCAGFGHAGQTWTANASTEANITDDEVIQAYEAACGYDPSNPETDQGGNELDVLAYFHKNGLAGITLDAYAVLDVHNHTTVKDAIWLTGGAYLGINLPITAQTQEIWEAPSQGTTGDGAPGSWGGHCVYAIAYTDQHLVVVTWGQLKVMTWAFWDAYVEEAYALLSKEWISTSGKAPSGFLYDDLIADMAALGDETPMQRLHDASQDPELAEIHWHDVTINIHWAAATWILGLICAGITAYGQGDTSAWSTWFGTIGIVFATWANLTKVQSSNLKTGDLVQAAADLIELLQKKRLR